MRCAIIKKEELQNQTTTTTNINYIQNFKSISKKNYQQSQKSVR